MVPRQIVVSLLLVVFALPTFADEFSETLLRTAVENTFAARSFDVKIKHFRAEIPKSDTVAKLILTHERNTLTRLIVDSERERGIAVIDASTKHEFADRKKNRLASGRNVSFYSEGTVRHRSGEPREGGRYVDRMTEFRDFLRTNSFPLGIPFGVQSETKDGLYSLLETRIDKYRKRAKHKLLEDGTSIVDLPSETKEGLVFRVRFDPVHQMPVEQMYFGGPEGNEVRNRQSVVYQEVNGLQLPVHVAYELSSEYHFAEVDIKDQVGVLGTIELEWLQVNPEILELPEEEKALANWPKSFAELMDPTPRIFGVESK